MSIVSTIRALTKQFRFNTYLSLSRNVQRFSSGFSSIPSKPNNTIIMRSVQQDSLKKVTHLTFANMFQHTKLAHHDKDLSISTMNPQQFLMQSAEFTRSEYTPRLAKLIMCLKNFPYDVADTDSVRNVIDGYISTYEKMSAFPKLTTMEQTEKFCDLCKETLLKHLLMIPKISYGLLQKATVPNTTFNISTCPYLNDFIDEFAEQRIAIRVLTGHLITMQDQIRNGYKNSGLFEENCDILKYLEKAIMDTKIAVLNTYNVNDIEIPQVNIYDKRKHSDHGFTYLPEHLHHMVFELLKNSMRAMIESNLENGDSIDIIIVNNEKDGSISIKISDVGGGISRDNIDNIWLYSYTTAFDDIDNDHNVKGEEQLVSRRRDKMIKQMELLGSVVASEENSNIKDVDRSVFGALKGVPMFGLGYGLPVVNVYAKYFGGNVKIQSVSGYGTDTYLYLNNLKYSDVNVI